ncbi:MAG TPA: o-succinylbenzoate synthase [Thermoplasmata archaeon]|nr:o-succinylbenzoate synthase [Thermoplasmata archaeon]
MPIVRAELDELELPLVTPFATSFGTQRRRRILMVRLHADDGSLGWGECVAASEPRYSAETVDSARAVIDRYLLPVIFREANPTPLRFQRAVAWIRGHLMARATVEMALWDLEAQRRRRSLASLLGARRRRIPVGVSVGIERPVAALVRRVGSYLEAGYVRVKLKVKPGWDTRPVAAVRREHPDVPLWVDANQAYPPSSARSIAGWVRALDVAIIEQPFPARALTAHAELGRQLGGRVALDESIEDLTGFSDAVACRALSALNVKPGRVGGLVPARALARRCLRSRIPAWVGGMLETGIGRAFNVALAATVPFSLPGDISASNRYFARDLVDPPFELRSGGTLDVPQAPGLGVTIDERRYRACLRRTIVRRRSR